MNHTYQKVNASVVPGSRIMKKRASALSVVSLCFAKKLMKHENFI